MVNNNFNTKLDFGKITNYEIIFNRLNQTSVINFIILVAKQYIYKSRCLSNKKSRLYGTSDLSIYLSALLKSASKCTYIWGRFSVHLRLILYTFEADSLYIWGQFSIHLRLIWANQTAVHLRQNLSDWLRHIKWQNKLSLPQMYGIGLKCIENWPQMYRESASNVQILFSDRLRQWEWASNVQNSNFWQQLAHLIWNISCAKKINIHEFRQEVYYIQNIEKYISISNGKLCKHNQK